MPGFVNGYVVLFQKWISY